MRKKLEIAFVTLLLVSLLQKPIATANEDIKEIKQFEPAPFSGVLMPEESFRFYMEQDEVAHHGCGDCNNVLFFTIGILSGVLLMKIPAL